MFTGKKKQYENYCIMKFKAQSKVRVIFHIIWKLILQISFRQGDSGLHSLKP